MCVNYTYFYAFLKLDTLSSVVAGTVGTRYFTWLRAILIGSMSTVGSGSAGI